ncbi:RNA polymerase II subunit A C-terminal domain phosphatase-like [Diadema antillarum]|uniref:RNA polymerase II subunit A C-terminal domain phosphatase-like n=1 Tax=Diadema antillarum TaxID=105358 RepID=UPI003A85464C
MAATAPLEISLCEAKSCEITKLKVKLGSKVSAGTILLLYRAVSEENASDKDTGEQKLKSQYVGTVQEVLAKEGDIVEPGAVLLKVSRCSHPTVMKGMCAECGEDLRRDEDVSKKQAPSSTASVAMVHSIPELHVTKEEAAVLAKQDEDSLIKHRKLVLLVDLDQTLIHTTLDDVPPDMPGVHHFQLRKGPLFPWYHTKIRDGCNQFLDLVSQYYQLHIFTMGVRLYAHTVAEIIDPDGKFFSHRILSRDECFDPNSKTANLKSIFPRGDKMVCIIDDRDDVWNYAPNLIQVPPFRFFEGTGDINTPPNLANDRGTPPVHRPRESSTTYVSSSGSSKSEEAKKSAELEDSGISEEDEGKNQTEQSEAVESEVCSSEVSSTTKDAEQEDSKDEDAIGEKTKKNGDGDTKEAKEEKEEGEITQEKDSDNEKVTTTAEEKEAKEDGDDYFMYLGDILIRIHRTYFSQVDAQPSPRPLPDLKVILPKMKTSVLKGCNIVFSGVFPTNMPPEQSRAWKVANALGAKVSPQVITKSKEDQGKGRATTHLVAATVGTSKVHLAKRSRKIYIVEPDWLWCCWERWERVDERLFLLPDVSKHGSRSSTPGYSDTESTGSQKSRKGKAKSKSMASTNGKSTGVGNPAQRTKARPLSLSEDYNPMYSFSSEDLASMDREVQDMCDSSDDSTSDSGSSDSEDDERSNPTSLGSVTRPASSSSDDESLTAESPRGWKRKRDDMDSENDDDMNDFDPFQRPQEDSSSSAGLSEEEWFSEEEGQKMANAIDDLLTYKRSVRKWDQG